ncbi:DUF1592 domain-containing protein [Rhodocytophaga aerolata]|uniref:DUF1592 domain-containing protein n=1 Tax=Rhodocytophaga aerolata TaxID=455078 RepID=A0ABT8R598_9BACT|nr:DUF1592 domain-containing protein [Rhodocytophaga aerolata]MDO1446574.1 DUF1592 domain-containing protein [Rhodocytophaga aerolata]
MLKKVRGAWLFFLCISLSAYAAEPESEALKDLRLLVEKHCVSCHKESKMEGGVQLDGIDSEGRITRAGHLWMKALKQVQAGEMPPQSEPPMSMDDQARFIKSINEILAKALKEGAGNPGRVVARRLSHDEYRYSVLSLTGVDFDAKAYFPADGSGGAGFDNFARTMFLTPLKMERYYEAAETILDKAYSDKKVWRQLVPNPYKESWWQAFVNWFLRLFSDYSSSDKAVTEAEKVIVPFASKAYRRFLKPEEKEPLLDLFRKVYEGTEDETRYDIALKETFKTVLLSPKFLYRIEDEQPLGQPFALSNFELANRLSYFLWSTLPDQELFEVAYRENLHNPAVLNKQVKRMLRDPKAKRFSESFATQWFGISKLKDNSPVDPERYPEFTPSLRKAMYQEMVEYFHHVLTSSHNFLDLIDSDYTFLNEELAKHYGIAGVEGEQMRKVPLQDRTRGGVLGMGSVLTATSLPIRTSPVLRGKWVLEEILGTPAPPPPPDAGQLPEQEAAAENASIRDLLVLHRSKPDCMSCHKKMDPVGFGLENFDAVGRWRTSYGDQPIVAWDTLPSGEIFRGPAELKKILLTKEENFARVLAEKMFTYSIGRSVEFIDEPYMKGLVDNLLENDFHTEKFIIELVNSYPFRYKVNDGTDKFKSITKK